MTYCSPHIFSWSVCRITQREDKPIYNAKIRFFESPRGTEMRSRFEKSREHLSQYFCLGDKYSNCFKLSGDSKYRKIGSTLRCICSTKKNKHELSMKESKFDHYLFNLKNILDLVTAFATFRKMLHSINKTQLC